MAGLSSRSCPALSHQLRRMTCHWVITTPCKSPLLTATVLTFFLCLDILVYCVIELLRDSFYSEASLMQVILQVSENFLVFF